MSFIIVTSTAGKRAAECDFCARVVPVKRTLDGLCVLPAGWGRVGDKKEVGNEVLLYSVLMCDRCIRTLAPLKLHGVMQWVTGCLKGECDRCTVHLLKGELNETNTVTGSASAGFYRVGIGTIA